MAALDRTSRTPTLEEKLKMEDRGENPAPPRIKTRRNASRPSPFHLPAGCRFRFLMQFQGAGCRFRDIYYFTGFSQVKSGATPRGNMKAARSVNHRGLPGGGGLWACIRRTQKLLWAAWGGCTCVGAALLATFCSVFSTQSSKSNIQQNPIYPTPE